MFNSYIYVSMYIIDQKLFFEGNIRHLLLHIPDVHDTPTSHSGLSPHLHIPDSQVSAVCPEQIGPRPHEHLPVIQVSDKPVHPSFPVHKKAYKYKMMLAKKFSGHFFLYLYYVSLISYDTISYSFYCKRLIHIVKV